MREIVHTDIMAHKEIAEIRRQLRLVRKKVPLTQAGLARKMEMTNGHISRMEQGKRGIELDVAIKWAGICGYELKLVKLGEPNGLVEKEDLAVDIKHYRELLNYKDKTIAELEAEIEKLKGMLGRKARRGHR